MGRSFLLVLMLQWDLGFQRVLDVRDDPVVLSFF
jgi:hypothetical protein